MEVLAFHREEELPADFALDLRLHEILEDALGYIPATGALIALASGDKMVCRATSGEKAPTTGSLWNTRSGLSGLCVQTREMQRCDDTRTDARVNSDACRLLDVRSIVVLPVLEGARLWGILEIFSSRPHAFSDADVPQLRALGRRVSHTVREAVDGGSVTPGPDTWPVVGKANVDQGDMEQADKEAREILKSGLQAPSVSQRDYRTTALTVAVIALAVLLGWMVGRVGWSIAVDRAQPQVPISPEETQPIVSVTPPAEPPVTEEPANLLPVTPSTLRPPPKPDNAANTEATTASKTVATTTTKTTKTEKTEPSDGLVVYEQGKVVFRTPSAAKAPPSVGNSSPIQNAVNTEGIATAGSAAISPPAASYLLQRVEPEYPEDARQRHIEGPVVLKVLVGTDGAVQELKVVSGDPLLAKAATDAVRRWRFQPHHLDNRLVEFETRITVNFALP
jgi:TonB family protein